MSQEKNKRTKQSNFYVVKRHKLSTIRTRVLSTDPKKRYLEFPLYLSVFFKKRYSFIATAHCQRTGEQSTCNPPPKQHKKYNAHTANIALKNINGNSLCINKKLNKTQLLYNIYISPCFNWSSSLTHFDVHSIFFCIKHIDIT